MTACSCWCECPGRSSSRRDAGSKGKRDRGGISSSVSYIESKVDSMTYWSYVFIIKHKGGYFLSV